MPWAAVAATGGLVGGVVAWLGSGLGATLGAETGFGLAAGFAVATGTALGQAWRGRADDDPGRYADGFPVELVATAGRRNAAIAVLAAADGATLAELHLETLHSTVPPDVALDVAPAGGVDTVTARVAGRVLRLQHRHPSETAFRARPAADLADLEVRWVDDRGHPVATAARRAAPGGDRWSVTGRVVTLAWTVPTKPGRRPARRLLHDATRDGRVFLLVHPRRRRGPRVRFSAPQELSAAEVLLYVWLCHLLDAHATAREPWPAATTDWALVPDDFPSIRVGPAGLGGTLNMPTGSVNVSPGGS